MKLKYVLLISVLGVIVWESFSQQNPLARKNIDNLDSLELSAYLHAWSILKQKSEENPFDTTGYLWQAWVHNLPVVRVPVDGALQTANPGMCEHGTTLFLTWHRAELYYFEKVLQLTDPEGKFGPSTKNVTIPYWSWLRPASGDKFPKIFEDTTSVLFQPNRFQEKVDTPLVSRNLVAYQVYFLDWLDFGGGPANSPGYGDFEREAHNTMHGEIGADMSNAFRAALDPIFFSFHCYIDLIFERWIENHGTEQISSPEVYLKGTQPSAIRKPPGFTPPPIGGQVMGQPKNYYDTRALGYYYEITAYDSLPQKSSIDSLRIDERPFGTDPESLQARLLDGGSYKPSTDEKSLILNTEFKIPEKLVQVANLVFTPENGLDTLNYQVDVYLYPDNISLELSNEEFINRYLAESYVYWGKGGHHKMHMSSRTPKKTTTKLDNEINSIVATQRGKNWIISTVVSEKEPDMVYEVKGNIQFNID